MSKQKTHPVMNLKNFLIVVVIILFYANAADLNFDTAIPTLDGVANLNEGKRLFELKEYDKAAMHFWRAVLMHESSGKVYKVEEAFQPFVQCFAVQGRVADAFVHVASESLGRNQVDMGKMYLKQALAVDPTHEEALMLQKTLGGDIGSTSTTTPTKRKTNIKETSKSNDDTVDVSNLSPEELHEMGTHFFSDRNYEECADVFELSCLKSGKKLFPSCANAVYCRNMIIDWGFNGTQFEHDMERITMISKQEMNQYRTVDDDGVFHWDRSTSTHPHMMLGYPIESVLKRYVTEGAAYLDERHARIDHETMKVKPLPDDLPYDNNDDRADFLHDAADANFKLKVGFVASGFNSKAVLYLSHDMFRFFDKDRFEIHIFSMGPPDSAMFIEHGMRGVDWRERVKANVDFFHDVQQLKLDHVALARLIHDTKIHILIEWDGYARQGERAQGLFALRPAPVQILHQEFLGTYGAQYMDYIFTDKVASPPHLERLYTEKFIYMPNHFFSKGHAVQAEVTPPNREYAPAQIPYKLGTGSPQENKCMASSATKPSIVYCNFNKFLKNNPETVRSWIRILREVPDSMLCLLENPKEGVPYLRKFIHEAAGTSRGNADEDSFVEGDGNELNSRTHFLPWQRNPFDHQRRNHDFCNVMLDSYPYNGHTVAQDSLYAGVPIVTRSDGQDMCSRVTTSSNIVLGIEHLNAYKGTRQYEDIAIVLGNNATMFKETREKLISSCLQKNPMHPYWDVPRYVKNFQAGLEIVWQRYLDGKLPDHVTIVESSETQKGSYNDVFIKNPPEGKKDKGAVYTREEL